MNSSSGKVQTCSFEWLREVNPLDPADKDAPLVSSTRVISSKVVPAATAEELIPDRPIESLRGTTATSRLHGSSDALLDPLSSTALEAQTGRVVTLIVQAKEQGDLMLAYSLRRELLIVRYWVVQLRRKRDEVLLE